MIKPTYREIDGKLRQARTALTEGRIAVVAPAVLAADALDLEYDVSHLLEILGGLLDITSPRHYAGSSPPLKSYSAVISGCDLYAFAVPCPRFGCGVYFKFAFKNDTLWLVSLHRERPARGG